MKKNEFNHNNSPWRNFLFILKGIIWIICFTGIWVGLVNFDKQSYFKIIFFVCLVVLIGIIFLRNKK